MTEFELSDEDKRIKIKRLMEKVGPNRLKAHMSMTYQCRSCRLTWLMYAGVGVEGPFELRESGDYIASPFTMPCGCGETAQHVDWNRDQHYDPYIDIEGWSAFVVPENGPDLDSYMTSAFCGEVYKP